MVTTVTVTARGCLFPERVDGYEKHCGGLPRGWRRKASQMYPLSQAMGQKFGGSVGKFGAALAKISTAYFTKSSALRMNSLENLIKSNHF